MELSRAKDVVVGVGGAADAALLPVSRREADECLTLASGGSPVVYDDSWHAVLLRRLRLMAETGRLPDRNPVAVLLAHDAEHGTVLLATLAAYLASGGKVPATCEALVIHRNTLRYRLLSIRRLTGLDPYSLEARVELWLALVAGGVAGDQGGRDLGQATATPVSGAGDAR